MGYAILPAAIIILMFYAAWLLYHTDDGSAR